MMVALSDGYLPFWHYDDFNGAIIMGLRHREAPMHGVQFHPESVLTEGGYLMLGNWLEEIGVQGAAQHAKTLSPLIS